ncbi:MAG: hypothetical protein M1831_000228 [Alyxoria varia]|nr:MAG: hypothetical protein M1831_000228 [Alyxoria varia]
MLHHGDHIAGLVTAAFERLPQKAKPRIHPGGIKEWVPLSGIVISHGSHEEKKHECVSLGTGMRCLQSSKLHLAEGNCLHDWHAEIVAIRAFNLFILQKCMELSQNPKTTSYILHRQQHPKVLEDGYPPFTINDDVDIHMYCSECPCGDSSMELTMKAQADATPWQETNQAGTIIGRGHFSKLGVVRRKPSRADAPVSLSKSCSDKLALKQCTSLLSGVVSLLVSPANAYLKTLVIPQDQYVDESIKRAFTRNGRMGALGSAIEESWMSGYGFHSFEVTTTSRQFNYSKASTQAHESQHKRSNMTAMWTPGTQEALIGGVRQGNRQFTGRGASLLSRRRLWQTALSVAKLAGIAALSETLQQSSYAQVKTSPLLSSRRRVKKDVCTAALTGWVPNTGDEQFFLDPSYG